MYELLSKYYDAFMPDELYEGWAQKLLPYLKGEGADLGCGSGRMTLLLKKAGLDVYGVDISEEMLSKAYQNAAAAGLKILFLKGNINAFSPPHTLDFVTANCDVVNYIKSPLSAFQKAFAALKEGGVFVFDVSTVYKLTHILGFNTYSESVDDITYIWKNFLSRNRKSVDMELTFFVRQGECYQKSQERETQYIHDEKELQSLLREAGFKSVSLYGDDFSKFTARSQRAHFVAKK